MKAQVESISPVKAKLLVEISPDEIQKEEAAAYRDLQRKVTVAGFRKGKAPVPVLKRLYGGKVMSEVLSDLMRKTYVEALRERDIVPVSDADIDLQQPREDGTVTYTAVVDVRPKVEARGYDGLPLKKERIDVSETDVQARLETLRREHATLEPAPEGHGAEEGDLVVVDFEGSVDGRPFEGGKGTDRSLTIGAGRFIPGFEEGLLGAVAGEERTVEAQFPPEHGTPELAGRRAEFRILVKEVKVRRLPEVDDDFAREAAQAESLEELQTQIRSALETEKERHAEEEFRDRLIDMLLAANPFEVPESLVRRQTEATLESVRKDFAQRGLDFESMGFDQGKIRDNYRRGAERAVRWAFLLNAIASAEGLEVSDEDVNERIRSIAQADGRPYNLIRSFFDDEDKRDSLRTAILQQKVVGRVVAKGQVEVVSREELPEKEGPRE